MPKLIQKLLAVDRSNNQNQASTPPGADGKTICPFFGDPILRKRGRYVNCHEASFSMKQLAGMAGIVLNFLF
ncbi:MAG: hypothetical protein NTZ12_05735 [Candidatus Aminicenantes bacterium]|nr:hypothetical protein [Candidatus Aminicenantes bacterium]